jgi:hypothetical protein
MSQVSRIDELPSLLVKAATGAFGEHLHAVVVHGSGHRHRDFIPFWSDFDCHIYFASSILETDLADRVDRAFQFRRAYAGLSPEDYGVYYIQVFFLLADFYPNDWPAPLDGSFELVYGSRPSGWDSADRGDHLAAANTTLAGLGGVLDTLPTQIPELTGPAFPRWVRTLGTIVKPALYCAATIMTGDAAQAWGSTIDETVDLVSEHLPISSAVDFYGRARNWLSVRSGDSELEAMARDGIDVLAEAPHLAWRSCVHDFLIICTYE